MEIVITLDNEEVLTCLNDGFCNGGLGMLESCDVGIEWDKHGNQSRYDKAKHRLVQRNGGGTMICFEDVLCEILRDGEAIVFTDFEDGEDENGKQILLTLGEARERLKIPAASKWILQVLPEENYTGDATTGFVLLQIAMFNEILF